MAQLMSVDSEEDDEDNEDDPDFDPLSKEGNSIQTSEMVSAVLPGLLGQTSDGQLPRLFSIVGTASGTDNDLVNVSRDDLIIRAAHGCADSRVAWPGRSCAEVCLCPGAESARHRSLRRST